MEIREAAESDIPAIVELLKKSLGESLMPKTEAYWRWKHLLNPFGPSPVLLCVEKGNVVGVRAFMRWEWRNDKQVYRALRAVDTATHPDYQGKGLFKKLTLSLIDSCAQQGDHLIFNTPNQQSKPGYLKMGWIEAGKLPIRVSLERPFKMLWRAFSSQVEDETQSSPIEYYLKHPYLSDLLEIHNKRINTITTHGSPGYLNWRYLNVPVARYLAIGDEASNELRGLILGRIKQTRWGREMRITDFFWNGKGDGRALKQKLKEMKKLWKIDYTTMSGVTSAESINLFSGLKFKGLIGPMVTLRSLQLNNLASFSNFQNWSPSLGDLELF
jgi:N-acetylglutamate synthase-like GNAT family acetyltransferase